MHGCFFNVYDVYVNIFSGWNKRFYIRSPLIEDIWGVFVCLYICQSTLTLPLTFYLYKVQCSYLVYIFFGPSTFRQQAYDLDLWPQMTQVGGAWCFVNTSCINWISFFQTSWIGSVFYQSRKNTFFSSIDFKKSFTRLVDFLPKSVKWSDISQSLILGMFLKLFVVFYILKDLYPVTHLYNFCFQCRSVWQYLGPVQ